MTTEFQICPLQQEFLSKSWTKMTTHQSFKSIPIRLEFSAQRQEVSKIQSIEYMPWTKTRVLMLSYHTGCKESEPVNSMWRKPVVKSMLMKLSLDHIVLGCVLKCCFHEIQIEMKVKHNFVYYNLSLNTYFCQFSVDKYINYKMYKESKVANSSGKFDLSLSLEVTHLQLSNFWF